MTYSKYTCFSRDRNICQYWLCDDKENKFQNIGVLGKLKPRFTNNLEKYVALWIFQLLNKKDLKHWNELNN